MVGVLLALLLIEQEWLIISSEVGRCFPQVSQLIQLSLVWRSILVSLERLSEILVGLGHVHVHWWECYLLFDGVRFDWILLLWLSLAASLERWVTPKCLAMSFFLRLLLNSYIFPQQSMFGDPWIRRVHNRQILRPRRRDIFRYDAMGASTATCLIGRQI